MSVTVVQGQLTTIRDNIQRRLLAVSAPPLGFADDSDEQSLGYAADKTRANANPLYTKAPPPSPAAAAGLAVWAQAYGDYEHRSGVVNGFDTGRIQRTGGILAGIDKVFPNVLGGDALVIGVLTGDMVAQSSNVDGSSARLDGPSIGTYAIWINGAFSVDSTFKVDFIDINQTDAFGTSTPFGVTNYSWAFNVNRKFEFSGWWIEPTAGFIDIHSVWNGAGHALGLSDGNDFRIQAGGRIGTNFVSGRTPVEATLTLLAYDHVSITGGTLLAATGGAGGMGVAPTDEGKIFGQAVGKLNFDWSNDIKGLSSYVEGEIRGSTGVVGVAGRIGARYSW